MPLHLMMLPAIVLLFVYSYVPMLGFVMAFQKFDIYLGLQAFWKSSWVGFQNYIDLIKMGEPVMVVRNTVIISFLKITIGFFVPIAFSVLLNEIRKTALKRTIQTVIYMPHFLSWVIIAGILRQILSSDGLINNFATQSLGIESIPFLSSNKWFMTILIVSNIWKEFGFNTIVYLAAIASIDPTLYEAAIVDGANRWKQTWHVTFPGMRPIVVLTLVLSLQNVLNAGFDQIFNLYSPQVYETADIIDTWVYRMSFQAVTPMYDLSIAISLFKSLVALIFISVSYWLAKKVANYQIF